MIKINLYKSTKRDRRLLISELIEFGVIFLFLTLAWIFSHWAKVKGW
jgi:hypothetical protein